MTRSARWDESFGEVGSRRWGARLFPQVLSTKVMTEARQARAWRRIAGGQRSVAWRVRSLGHGRSRVQLLPSRAGAPLLACLQPEAVLVLDAVVCVFVWVGEAASEEDETLGMQVRDRG